MHTRASTGVPEADATNIMPLTISMRAAGKRRPLLEEFSVPSPSALRQTAPILLRALITHVVEAEVRAFNARQKAGRFDRLLSATEVHLAAEAGRVNPAAREEAQQADAREAVDRALLAFTDGLYLVLVDGMEQRELDRPVPLREDSRLTFLRLTFLAGA